MLVNEEVSFGHKSPGGWAEDERVDLLSKGTFQEILLIRISITET